ncbi:helix-turn-helix domain-containing protein [Pedobacter sp. SYSU D00535]|uniref:helix-turn-helix domain-containing protein n=1 Tax=Pedobacter sp. SYSU D00535 TaxID=2810308 RepID=UPI001A96FC38|nr:helix-turn-helix domain-containing protein [Pedobacter sp. SYSU D00535]
MQPEIVPVPADLSSYVNNILVLRSAGSAKTVLPFYADGYPGIIYQQSSKGIIRLPDNKPLSRFFAYGQTIQPIELVIEGDFLIVIFQLFPLTLLNLFGLNPQNLNDDCSDLRRIVETEGQTIFDKLQLFAEPAELIAILSNFLRNSIKNNPRQLDQRIRKSVELIIAEKGTIPMKKVLEAANCSERTFQRQFKNQIGVNPKQFARMIQFQHSYMELIERERATPELIFENGFSDQSHFIKTIRRFTGETPSYHRKKDI